MNNYFIKKITKFIDPIIKTNLCKVKDLFVSLQNRVYCSHLADTILLIIEYTFAYVKRVTSNILHLGTLLLFIGH
jgi:hypothetical protein